MTRRLLYAPIVSGLPLRSNKAVKGEVSYELLRTLNNPPKADKRSSKITLKAGRWKPPACTWGEN